MMKSRCLLCFLSIIAVSSIARGQDGASEKGVDIPTPPPEDEPEIRSGEDIPTPPPEDEPEIRTNSSSSSSTSPNYTSANPGDKLSPVSTSPDATTENSTNEVQGGGDFLATATANGSTAPQTTATVRTSTSMRGVITDITTVTTAMTTTLLIPVMTKDRDSSSWGYILLALIILVIIALCFILFYLRKGARTYSFDLHRQVHLNHTSGIEHTGTFEPVNLNDLDRPAPIDHVTSADISPSPVANGMSLQSEKESTGENGSLGVLFHSDGLETPPINFDSFSLDIDLTDKKADQSHSPTSFFDTTGEEQQNGNNNNPSVPNEPFVEINLDEPIWINHLLTSPASPSSVLPFSPFSLSSSVRRLSRLTPTSQPV